MSSQLEFIMQLYMMNLLQQQQQQQQHQQQNQQLIQNLSPNKQQQQQKDIIINTTTAANTANTTTQLPNATFTPIQQTKSNQQQRNATPTHNEQQQQHQQQQDKRTQKRQNSQNTNCSSSRSSSPNSNSSFIQSNNLVNHQTQQQPQQLLQHSILLPNTIPNSLTQLMLQQQQQQQHHLLTTPSNLLLTPTTPNSSSSSTHNDYNNQFSKTSLSLSDYMNALGNNIGQCSSNYPFTGLHQLHQHTTPNIANISFTAQNFLQSSTVTSTPTEEKSLREQPHSHRDRDHDPHHEHDDDDDDVVNGNVGDGDDESSDALAQQSISTISANIVDDDDEHDGDNDERHDDNGDNGCQDEDDLPLSSLQTSSSGIVSSCTTSGESSSGKLLLSTDLQGLESSSTTTTTTTTTATTFDDTNPISNSIQQLPYTPIKQEADSSLSCGLNKDTPSSDFPSYKPNSLGLSGEEMTPIAMAAQALLTPPSSDQLIISNVYDKTQTTLTVGGTNSLAGVTAQAPLTLTTASSLDAFLQNEENLKNLKKYSSYLECENTLCRQENLREHFHCFDGPCEGKILSKKDDIIRHLKWHKKRKESLQLGFARFSSSDDCAPTYGLGCAYNWKQTHYHCVYEDCPKVYVSTSDVQMHANFHRKNSEIVQEGFRRFRAHENCKIEDCPFYGKKMSHYHCCREGCNHTFKNKADMDKHKSYHLKDYQLTQDGFKKILKTEVCPFEDCKFSTVSNHIHCVRSDCNYILHSSSQMISHKRKHDRTDNEQAYQTFKKQQKESSEDESPTTTTTTTTTQQQQQQQQQHQQQQQQQQSLLGSCAGSNMSTPLSSHTSAEQFLSRKRGRPPKMIQLPADSSNTTDLKRFKFETDSQQQLNQQQQQLINLANSMPTASSMFPPFLHNFNSAAAAAAAMSSASSATDPNAPNFQLTHLMALFQLQNPLFYQNLYPGGMAGMLAAGTLPQNAALLGNLAAFNAAAAAAAGSTPQPQHIKSEFSDNKQ